jgi:hypothetical protein
MEQPPSTPSFVGIDVAKDRLDVHVRPAAEALAVARDGKEASKLWSPPSAAGMSRWWCWRPSADSN